MRNKTRLDEDLELMSPHRRALLVENAESAVRRRQIQIDEAEGAGRDTRTLRNAFDLETRYMRWARGESSEVVSS